MSIEELARLILGLRAQDWDDSRILNLILWTATGEDKYRNK